MRKEYSNPSEEPKKRIEEVGCKVGVAMTGPSVVKFQSAVPALLPRVSKAYNFLSKEGTYRTPSLPRTQEAAMEPPVRKVHCMSSL